MFLFFYTLLWVCLLPFIVLRLLYRSLRNPAYRQRWGERFGLSPYKKSSNCLIWVHAVSVGEWIAIKPLVEKLLAQYPHDKIVVTTMTPTGSAAVVSAQLPRVLHQYCPYDLPFAIRRFLHTFKPKLVVLVETEIWPQLIHQVHKQAIPIILCNARLSQSSARNYQKIRPFIAQVFNKINCVAVQFSQDGQRFLSLGLPKKQLQVTGSIKFDQSLDATLLATAAQLKQAGQLEQRFVWVAASTHAGEEVLCLKAHQALLKVQKNALLILAPRHPERRTDVEKIIQKLSLQAVRRSDNQMASTQDSVLLWDTLGELNLAYGLSDLAFVGGSLMNVGGHNVIEPALWAKPILVGPYTHNFHNIVDCKSSSPLAELEPAA